jgi:putative ABC transport system permease protein
MRGREIAVRSAIGASRWHIIRHLLAESVVLSGLGVVVGILIAVWGLDLLHAGMPPEVARYIPGWHRIGLNLPVLAITILVALAAGILSGILPAWAGSKVDLLAALKEGSRSSARKARHRLRSILVVSEIVLSLVLLIGAGLMAKGLRNVTQPGPNIDPAHVLKFDIRLPESRFSGTAEIRDFERQLLTKINSLPGVVSASLVSDMPYGGSSRSRRFTLEGQALDPGGEPMLAQIQSIDPRYFRTMHIPIVSGRDLSTGDGEEAQPVAVVSQRWVRRYMDGRNPVGRRVRLGNGNNPAPWVTVVGVAADIMHEPFDAVPRATIYQSYLQSPVRGTTYVLRTRVDPMSLAAAVRSLVAGIQADQPVGEMQTFAKTIHDNLLGVSYVAVLMGIFGVVALLLSAIGVYGVMAYTVTERTNEIGLRMALGAGRRDVLWMVGRWGMGLAAMGMALGIPAALGFSKLLSGLLVGVGSFDIPAFTAGAAVLSAAAMAACCVPVWRAVSVDPMIALRNE